MRWRLAGNLGERLLRCHGKLVRSVNQLWALHSYRRKLIATPICLLAIFILLSWTLQSNSCAFFAFFSLILFDIITLVGDLISQMWMTGGKPCTTYSFGLVRVEVLTHFSVLCLGLLLNCWAIKNSLELVSGEENHEIHTGRFIPGAIIGGSVHFFLSFNNNPFYKVYKVSSTTTNIQKCFQGICASFGLSLSATSSFALSPFAILGSFTISTILVLAFALQTGPRWFDLIGGFLINAAIFDALWPLCVYTAQVLLQTVPSHIVTQLEKSLREALTIDGVLEFRNELFWTLTYGQIAGTLHVRVRRDANEQLVLSKVHDKLQPLAPHLTVQITKDDFGRPFGNLHILRDLDSVLTQVTVGQSSAELSPIPNALGHVNHLIYTTSTKSHNHENKIPHFSDCSSIHHQSSPRSVLSSGSSFSHQNEPNEITIHGSSTGNNHLLAPPPSRVYHHHHHHHHSNPSNGRQSQNPFVMSDSTNNSQTVNQNLLISSANFFPES